jgi:RNA polymerase-interacting CarD/CdnL/TRCF family regulator
MEMIRSSETPVHTRTAWRYIQEDGNIHLFKELFWYYPADFRPSGRRSYVPPKRLTTYGLHDVISQEMAKFITAVVSAIHARVAP